MAFGSKRNQKMSETKRTTQTHSQLHARRRTSTHFDVRRRTTTHIDVSRRTSNCFDLLHCIFVCVFKNSPVRKQRSTAIRRNGIAGLESCWSETLGRVLRSKASKNKDSRHESFFSYVFVACAEKMHNTTHLKLRIGSMEHQFQWNWFSTLSVSCYVFFRHMQRKHTKKKIHAMNLCF